MNADEPILNLRLLSALILAHAELVEAQYDYPDPEYTSALIYERDILVNIKGEAGCVINGINRRLAFLQAAISEEF